MLKKFFAISAAAVLCVGTLSANDWFRYRGPDANGNSKETGWQTTWPTEGPKQLWKARLGTGFSSITISDGRVYSMGNENDTDTVFCFDANTGKQIWKHSYPAPLDPNLYEGGPNATPTVDGDRVYTFSRKGEFFCLDAAKGNVIWNTNVNKGLGLEIPTWGFSGSALVDRDLVILNAGEAGTAFDKKTGKVVWSSGKGVGGYSTLVPFDQGKERYVAIFGAEKVMAVHVKDGKLAWSFPWKTSYKVNAADPVIADGKMFISSGYNQGCALLDISKSEPTVIWQNKNMRNHLNSSVLWKGYLYGVDETELKCLALDSGEQKWGDKKFGKGSLMMADGKIIGLNDKGELMVANATPTEFKPSSRAQILGGKCWTVPVLSNGKIYARNAKGDLVCLDVSK